MLWTTVSTKVTTRNNTQAKSNLGKRWIIPIFCVTLFSPLGSPAWGQTLDQAVLGLLTNNCAALSGGSTAGLGTNLAALCGIPGTGSTGNSSGGGAAAVQTTGVSVQNSTVLRRLEEARGEEENHQARSGGVNLRQNWMASPLALLESVSSPMAQSGSGGGTGSASFSAGQQWNGFSLFGSGQFEALNRDRTTFQDGYDSTIAGITVGGDYRFGSNLVVGLAVNFSDQDGDFDGGGSFGITSYGPTVYALYQIDNENFIQVVGGYSRTSNEVSRAVNLLINGSGGAPDRTAVGTSSSDADGDIFTASILWGHDHPFGNLTVGPRAGLNYSNTHIHDYSEVGGTGVDLRYADQWVNSLQSVLGIFASYAVNTSFGVLVPQANAEYIHEFANSQRFITAQFVEDLRANPTTFRFQNEVPVRNFFNVGAGLVAVLPNGWQPFVNFRAMVGNSQFDNYAGTLGLRVEM